MRNNLGQGKAFGVIVLLHKMIDIEQFSLLCFAQKRE